MIMKQQVRELRERLGYSIAEAARRARVSIARLRVLLRGLDWRGRDRITIDVLHAAIKRKYSSPGYTLAQAAKIVGKPVAWVRQQIYVGTFRVLRTRWNRHRRYVSAPMLARLRKAAALKRPIPRPLGRNWLGLSEAADLAGVCTTTLMRWTGLGWLTGRPTITGQRFHTSAVKAATRRHWRTTTRQAWRDEKRPAWLLAELGRHTSEAAA
jgi:hypothetical protein